MPDNSDFLDLFVRVVGVEKIAELEREYVKRFGGIKAGTQEAAKVVKDELEKIEGSTAKGAQGFEFLEASADKLNKRLLGFAGGFVAGILISELQPALVDAARGLGDIVARMDGAGESSAKLTANVRPLADSIEILARRYKDLDLREAEQIKKNAHLATSAEEIRVATAQYRGEVQAVNDAFKKQYDAAVNVEGRMAAREQRLKSLEQAEKKWRDAISSQNEELKFQLEIAGRVADSMQSEIDARHSVREAILGDTTARAEHTKALLAEIENERAHGELTGQNGVAIKERAESIKKLIEDELAAYTERGAKIPPELAAEAEKWGAITEAAKAAAQASADYAKQTEDALAKKFQAERDATQPAVDDFNDKKERAAELRAELESLNDAEMLSTDQINRQIQAKQELADIDHDLANASNEVINAQLDTIDVNEKAKNAITELGNQYGIAAGQIDEAGNDILGFGTEMGKSFEELNQNVLDFATGAEGLGVGLEQTTQATGAQSEAVAGLAAHQAEFNRTTADTSKLLGEVGDSAEASGKKVKSILEQEAEAAAKVKNEHKEIAETHLPKIVELTKEWRRLMAEGAE